MKTSSNRIGHKARQDLKLLFRCFVSIALHRNEVVFKRIGIFFDALLEKKINEYNQFWPKILKKGYFSLFNPFLSYKYCFYKWWIFVWEWSVDVRYENYFPPFAEKVSVKRLEWKVFGYPLAMQISNTVDLNFVKNEILRGTDIRRNINPICPLSGWKSEHFFPVFIFLELILATRTSIRKARVHFSWPYGNLRVP